jgi:hypothetical protein
MMSMDEANDLDMPGYFLPEDSQFRLAKLRDHVMFLSRLAQPRMQAEDREGATEVRAGEIAICLELLGEQLDLVLAEMSWSASRLAEAPAFGPNRDTNAEPDARAEAEPYAGCDADLEVTPEASDTAGWPLVFGLTVAQVDELDRLVQAISAHGDVLAMSDPDDLADGTVPTLGQAIHDAAIEAREILDRLGAQRLVPLPRLRTGLGEERGTYRAGLAFERGQIAFGIGKTYQGQSRAGGGQVHFLRSSG